MSPARVFVALMFVGSGCAALMYEVIWFQMLRFVIGASGLSLGILLATFMGGMGLGSLLYHRLVPRSLHPLVVYALLETGIGLWALLLPQLMPAIDAGYESLPHLVHSDASELLLRAFVSALVLVPPTMMMGATLPAIARWLDTSTEGTARLGFFYGANIFGAILGAGLAGFWLLRLHDLPTATYVAVGINLTVGTLAVVAARQTPARAFASARSSTGPAAISRPIHPGRLYLVTLMSGGTALGAQIVWTRWLSIQFGPTVYVLTLILCVFLMGLGIGSTVGAHLGRKLDPTRLLGVAQGLLALAIVWAAYFINTRIPLTAFLDPGAGFWQRCLNDASRTLVAIFPATLLWGASFPLALAALNRNADDPARETGRLYAANTFGAIAGALAFSIVVLPRFGTADASRLLMFGAGLAAYLALFIPAGTGATSVRMRYFIAPLLITGGIVLLWPRYHQPHPALVSFGRNAVSNLQKNETEYVAMSDGTNASVAVTEHRPSGTRAMHVSGKVVASTAREDMRLQLMLGHIPALLHKAPRSALIIGYGAGITAGTFVLHPDIERIVIVEIEPAVPRLARGAFAEAANRVLADPRVELIIDDGRHFLRTTDETFDIITADPIHPWVKGAGSLYTREFFELTRSRLNPGGMVTQWVPLYETSEAAVKSEVATMFSVFPDGAIFNSTEALGYDLAVLGSTTPFTLDIDVVDQRLAELPKVQSALASIGLGSGVELARAFAGQPRDLDAWVEGAELNLDRNLRLEYLAGSAHFEQSAEAIFRGITQELSYPRGQIKGPAASLDLLEEWYRSVRQTSQTAR